MIAAIVNGNPFRSGRAVRGDQLMPKDLRPRARPQHGYPDLPRITVAQMAAMGVPVAPKTKG